MRMTCIDEGGIRMAFYPTPDASGKKIDYLEVRLVLRTVCDSGTLAKLNPNL